MTFKMNTGHGAIYSKLFLQILIVVVIMFNCCGCAYFRQRGGDLADVLTVSVEKGHANIGAQVGPLLAGLGYSEGKGVGLRSGVCGTYDYNEVNVVIFGLKSFDPDKDPSKGYEISSALILPVVVFASVVLAPSRTLTDEDLWSLYEAIDGEAPWQSWFQLEASVCMWGGVRCGLNLGEALDFILGWTTLDICGDDARSGGSTINIWKRSL